jgi:hypothetical protein
MDVIVQAPKYPFLPLKNTVSPTFASLTVVQVDGDWSDLVSHPGFWIYFARACGWYFLAGILASVLTLFFTSKNQAQAS